MMTIADRVKEAVSGYLAPDETLRAVGKLHSGSLLFVALQAQFGSLGAWLSPITFFYGAVT